MHNIHISHFTIYHCILFYPIHTWHAIYLFIYLLIAYLTTYCLITYLLSMYPLPIDLSATIMCYIISFFLNLPIQTWEFFFGCPADPWKHHPLIKFNSHYVFSLVLSDGSHYDHTGGGDDHCDWPTNGSYGPRAIGHPSLILPRHVM